MEFLFLHGTLGVLSRNLRCTPSSSLEPPLPGMEQNKPGTEETDRPTDRQTGEAQCVQETRENSDASAAHTSRGCSCQQCQHQQQQPDTAAALCTGHCSIHHRHTQASVILGRHPRAAPPIQQSLAGRAHVVLYSVLVARLAATRRPG